MVNSAVIVGNVGQDPEIKYFESGSVKASFSVAVNRYVGKDQKETDWFNVDVWGKTAEFVGEYIKKGTPIGVMGQIRLRTWNDEAGNLREYPYIHASEVKLLPARREMAPVG